MVVPKQILTRRKFLTSGSGALAAIALNSCRPRRAHVEAPSGPLGESIWSGIGFGIEMSMEIHGVTREHGERLGMLCEQSIQALQQAFSLYQEDSELSTLNRERVLSAPSDLFRELLAIAVDLQRRTLGFYQPAVHGAWQWLENRDSIENLKDDPEWNAQCAACDLKFLEIEPGGPIRLTHPLTQLSMNAIGQGFLADTVAARLRKEGVTTALLHLGESYAIGRHPEGRLWNLAIQGTPVNEETDLVGNVEFADSGLAVSANDAARLLIDPVFNTVRQQARVAAVVSSEGATVADAYATAFAVAPADQWPRLAATLKQTPGSQVHLWENNQLAFQEP
jgi:thiamine biosynthesis lipoprotein